MRYVAEHIVDEYGESTYKIAQLNDENNFEWYDKYELLTMLENGTKIIGLTPNKDFTDLDVAVQSSKSVSVMAARYTLMSGIGVTLDDSYYATSFSANPDSVAKTLGIIKGITYGVTMNCPITLVLDDTVENGSSFIDFCNQSLVVNGVHVKLDLRELTDKDLLQEIYMARWGDTASLGYDPVIDFDDRREYYERLVQVEDNVNAIIDGLDEEDS